MKTLKGPSLHLAQFSDENAPFNSLPAIAEWAAQTGFSALQIPASIGVYSTWPPPRKAKLTATI